ncbi:helix-turn-helix domain-containing protein [Acidiphilium sp. JA12-A1]|uniref:helix-turn-helix domain-containing protein n=1 Tax=Acidiphilium sp. JA12-A1 TaxID=1464546 RepID=UPI000460CDD5|nr:XRE family transcriptional regulator [Acidiphilium sp. JA12-A1]KDM68395.1 helix-turn-helix domain protein [Acidiphilium sp. JA12-A1]
MIGERLRIARRKSGLSLRDLAMRLGGQITHVAIGKYERGEMMPSSSVLIALAKALDVSLEFLAAPLEVRLGALEFRKKSGTSAQERAHVEALVLEHVERYLLIEEVLGLESAAWKAPFKPQTVSAFSDAERVANATREKWKLGHDPIPDVTELLEEHGIKVMLLRLPDSVSGLTCIVERAGGAPVPVIVVNENHNLERRRFTLLHELGHRLMLVEKVDEEKSAHRFASAMLMPADHLKAQVGQHRHGFGYSELIETKHLYGVAATALLMRFRDLEIISSEHLSTIFQTTARHWRKHEPEALDKRHHDGRIMTETPRRFRRLCYRALAEQMISLSKASELLQEPAATIAQEMRGGDAFEDNRQ